MKAVLLCGQPRIISREGAEAAGLKRFFTGEPCKAGHLAERYVINNLCRLCKLETEKRTRNPETKRASKRRWRAANRDKVAEQAKASNRRHKDTVAAWAAANHEKIRMQAKARYHANTEAIRRRDRERYALNPHPKRKNAIEWLKRNPDHATEHRARQRAQKARAEGSHTWAELRDLLTRQNYQCAVCSTCIANCRDADHIIPLSKGGSDYIANIQFLCPRCNRSKGAKLMAEWVNCGPTLTSSLSLTQKAR